MENKNYLSKAGDEEAGMAVAIVDIESIHFWVKDEIEAASATYWAAGYWA